MRILSVYASAHGSTAQVAGFLAETWRGRSIDTVLAEAGPEALAGKYDAYALGSAIHHGMWLPEMATFVRRSSRTLAEKPVYLWLTCLRVLEPGGVAYVTNNYLPNLTTHTLSFRKIGIFAGKVDTATLNRDEAWTLTFRYDGSRDPSTLTGDHRDWVAIRAWANAVADDLTQVALPASPPPMSTR